MTIIDIFNGDADGICALLQLRLCSPGSDQLVTGVKRDVDLLENMEFAGNENLTVLDISMEKNINGLNNALQAGAKVLYIDHHFPGKIPTNPNLQALINTEPDTCTSLLANDYLNGQQIAWAITGTFGDNLSEVAYKLAETTSWSMEQLAQLKEFGICINYNAYGFTTEDLFFKPDELYRSLLSAEQPLVFINEAKTDYQKLVEGYHNDLALATNLKAYTTTQHTATYILPDTMWARRVNGTFGNQLVNNYPLRAHAVLTPIDEHNYRVSIRAPKTKHPMANQGADGLARKFSTGGGRSASAGINSLPVAELELFIDSFIKHYR